MLQSAFPIVVFGAVAVSIVMSLIFLFSRGSMFDHIGDGGLTGESDPYGSPPPEMYASVASLAEQARKRLIQTATPTISCSASRVIVW